MSFVKRNYIDGETVITAENLNDIQDAIIQIVPDDVKQALLQIASKVAYIDEHGQDYYDALEAALYPDASLVSISAVYTQSGTVYDTDSLDSLKADLVVTATYSDSSTETVPSTDYTLSGTLTVGTSTITVAYGGKTDTFNVVVTSGWTLQWSYADGGLPSTVASNDWETDDQTPAGHTITFDQDHGIKWVGANGGYLIKPKNYQTTSVGVMEVVIRFGNNNNQYLNVRATLNTATDTLIGFLFTGGVKVNGSGTGYNFISDTAVNVGEDHTLRVERTASNGTIYLDGVEVYSGALRTLSGTNNVMISTSANAGSGTVFVKSIKFRHVS